MAVFLASIGMLFVATLVAVLVVRFAPGGELGWKGVRLPTELLLSTLLLVASSVTCELALRRIRRGDRRGLLRALNATIVLGLLFVVAQAWCWLDLMRAIDWQEAIVERSLLLAAWIFVVLTLVHALHVLGGLVPMAALRRRAAEGRYTASRHGPVEHVRTYWHFLGVVWLALLATLFAVVPSGGG